MKDCCPAPNSQVVVSLVGPDGAGKSTLARELKLELDKSNICVKVVHSHRWWRNVLWLPCFLARSRALPRVVILDRCLLDNGVEIARKTKLRASLRFVLFQMLALWGSVYDVKLLIIAPVSILTVRRPDEPVNKLILNHDLYTEAACCAQYIQINSIHPTKNEGMRLIRAAIEAKDYNSN